MRLCPFVLGFAIVACNERSTPPAPSPAVERSRSPRSIDAAESAPIEEPIPPRVAGPARDLDDLYKEMVLVPKGWLQSPPTKFWMYSFYIDRTEVTVAQYRECVKLGACREPRSHPPSPTGEPDCSNNLGTWSAKNHDEHPVTCIDAADAHSYCSQRGKRLPTSTEWRYAARGNDKRAFPWGDAPPKCDQVAFQRHEKIVCKNPRTRPVGTTKLDISPFGVLDMAGNVSEFVLEEGIHHLPLAHDEEPWPTMGGSVVPFTNDLDVDESGIVQRANPGVGFRCAAGGKPR